MTRPNLDVSLLQRQIGEKRRHTSIKTFYGHREWVEDLDITNELGGHTGCVNALCWSKSGRLLASGSDDTHLNIWAYNPEFQAKPFSLHTSVSTGHLQNIFSVKFMPHSNDRTVITAAGDSQVRIFDIEYTGSSATTSADSSFSASTRSRRFNNFFKNARFLNEGNTNARVYRSHADRVKRIVTESSPHLFLTCSEDGEVRQWDLRQPSSAYPAPRGGAGFMSRRRAAEFESDDVPPPLISYKKYNLDLNSISCSASQPQYIALGGAHLHCFLHDRRMLGRDTANERGESSGGIPQLGSKQDEEMSQATRCVRRFAPNGKRKMGQQDNGHITACKISDANPNEMVASWSGDHIYSFDLVQSPDARETAAQGDTLPSLNEADTKLRDQKDRKRKRAKPTASSTSLADPATGRRRLRRVADDQQELGQTALRVRYGNGQTDDLPIVLSADGSTSPSQVARQGLLTEAQKLSDRIAKSLVSLRKSMFDFSAATRDVASQESSSELTPHTAAFTSVLGQSASLLTQMDDVIRDWSYPINPSPEDVTLQQTMRRNRQASWRFVQACGCLAKTMGGRLQTLSSAGDPRLAHFEKVRPAAREGRNIEDGPRFCYDFLKAILLWLEGGQHFVEAFKRPPELSNESQRFPLDVEDLDGTDESIEKVSRYLLDLASDQKSIIDLDTNQFERDEHRITFFSQKEAVEAFVRVLKGASLGQNGEPSNVEGSKSTKQNMDRAAACRFWGVKVGRSLLMEAGEGVNYDFVNRAFGGLRLDLSREEESETSQEEMRHDQNEDGTEITENSTALEAEIATVEEALHRILRQDVNRNPENSAPEEHEAGTQMDIDTTGPTSDAVDNEAEREGTGERDSEDENEDSYPDLHFSDDEEDDDDDDDDDDDHEETFHNLFRRRGGLGRSRERASVNATVPYSSHTRAYKGHCNVKTVKDVNYYGLNDEYVVSGSDDGHFFIWDRKTTELVNILEGDGEVVNVVQGHPYEPMIAVSGIDSTVKIFGTGGRERDDAEKGINVANPGTGRHSSLRMFGRRRRTGPGEDEGDGETGEGESEVTGGLASRKAMDKSYEILSQNDLERRSGVEHAFLTRGMLARLAAQINQGQITLAAGAAGGGGIVIDDNCSVM